MTFRSSWSATSHPTNFPPSAHFSPLVGGVHDSRNTFWRLGQPASRGIEMMAEVGATAPLRGEINAVRPSMSLMGGGISMTDGGTTSIDFRASAACPLATFVSMVAPSHDWFVGVSGMDLRDGDGRFVDQTVDLFVYDAGTEEGEDFSFNGPPSNPHGVITRLTTEAADTDFANGVHRGTGVFVGQFLFAIQGETSRSMSRVTAAPAVIAMDGGVSTVTVSRDGAATTDDVVVPLTFGGSAVRNADYRASADSVTIPAGETGATMTLTATMRDVPGAPDKTIVIAVSDIQTATVALTDMAVNAGLHRAILPEVGRVIADQGMSAVAGRMEQILDETGNGEMRVTVGDQSTLIGAVTTHGQAIAEGTTRLRDMLGVSDFTLPLTESQANGLPGRITLWGGGDYRNLKGADGAADWDGDLFSARLGVDTRLRHDVLAGLAVSWSQGDFDYLFRGRPGDYALDLVGIHPYVGWLSPDEGLDLWVTAGYGWGEVEIADQAQGRHSGDVELHTIGAGGSGLVWKTRTTGIRVKGEVSHTTMEVAGGERIAELTVEARRVRIALHGTHRHTLAGGARLDPTLEVGVRHDAGDGRTGTGAEVGGGLRYTDRELGLKMDGRGRVLLVHNGDYESWGIGGMVTLDPGAVGRGLFVSVAPTVGDTASRVSRLWAQDDAVVPGTAAASTPRGRMDMRLGYGLERGETLVTPYGILTLFDGRTRVYRLGGRLRMSDQFTLDLEGTRREVVDTPMDHGVLLKIGGNW